MNGVQPEPGTGPRRHAPGWLAALVSAQAEFLRLAGGSIGAVIDLYARIWIAQAFLISGLLKLGNWEVALTLAREEYPVSWLDPLAAAYLGASIELVPPLFLALGLATRLAAMPLLALSLVIQFEYQALDTHLLWAAILGWYVVRGAGPLSLDRLLARGIADSALPLGNVAVRTSAWMTEFGGPIYLLAMRVWLAAAMAVVFTAPATNAHADWLPAATLEPLATPFGAALAVALALGLAVRPTAALLLIHALAVEMADPGRIDATHGVVLLLAFLAVAGGGALSADALFLRLLDRRYPNLGSGPKYMDVGQPRVVIVGAGFGGLACAQALRRTPASITLIDRHNYHLFQPLLYQVATTALSPGDIAVPIRTLLREQANARVLLGEVRAVDSARKDVLLDSRRIPYDYLVIATGASHSYFGRDEWAPFAPGLKRIEDATDVRSRLLMAFERAEAAEDAGERAVLMTFLIVGAGPTGVELAGAIAELARFGMEREFRHVDPTEATVILVQSGPRILPTFPESLSADAEAALRRLGVQVLTESRVQSIDEAGVLVSGRRIEARTVFWAAGVVASPAASWLGVEADSSGRVKVAHDLSVPGRENVFAVGDTALSNGWGGRPVPGLGPAAKQGGDYVGRSIRARITGRRPPAPFRYRHLGSLATIGRKAAVADFGFVRLAGTAAWWLWGLVHVYFLAGVRNRISVMLDWAWAYFTFRSSTRLITAPQGGNQALSAPNAESRTRHVKRS